VTISYKILENFISLLLLMTTDLTDQDVMESLLQGSHTMMMKDIMIHMMNNFMMRVFMMTMKIIIKGHMIVNATEEPKVLEEEEDLMMIMGL
jgi:hypothetical protein